MYDEKMPEPRTGHDTENATKFHDQDAPAGYRKDGSRLYQEWYWCLDLYNTGRFNYNWRDESHERLIENLAMFDSIASQLDLTDRQRGIGRSRFTIPDFRRYSQLGGVRMAAFCMCALVCAEDQRDYYPTRKPETNDPEFVRMAEELDLNKRYIQKGIERLRSELNTHENNNSPTCQRMLRNGV
jgi:hypothetical protein